MVKVPHQGYTVMFKEAPVKRVKDEQDVSAVAGNWVCRCRRFIRQFSA
jgi:hypothetical protein